MARVIGLGGLFIGVADREEVAAWYRDVLGLAMSELKPVATFQPAAMAERRDWVQLLSFFERDSEYLKPTSCGYMINLCVDDLDGVLERCRARGVEPIWQDDTRPEGRFAHILDPTGMKIELWQPPE